MRKSYTKEQVDRAYELIVENMKKEQSKKLSLKLFGSENSDKLDENLRKTLLKDIVDDLVERINDNFVDEQNRIINLQYKRLDLAMPMLKVSGCGFALGVGLAICSIIEPVLLPTMGLVCGASAALGGAALIEGRRASDLVCKKMALKNTKIKVANLEAVKTGLTSGIYTLLDFCQLNEIDIKYDLDHPLKKANIEKVPYKLENSFSEKRISKLFKEIEKDL